VTFLVEMIANGGVNGDELLQTPHSAKAQHRPFSSSKRPKAIPPKLNSLMADFDPAFM